MIDFQTHFVFPTHAVPLAGRIPPDAEEWQLRTPDRATLKGVHFKPAEPSSELVLGFGGNGWNGQDVGAYLHEVYPRAHVVVFHYRGYAPSTGTPSAEALIADAPLVYDFAVDKLAPTKVFAAGFSIGSGIACELATIRKLKGIVLVTPFDSLKAVAQSFYPWLPISALFAHEVAAADALEKAKVPAAIIAAERDEIVAIERTDALRQRAPKLVFDTTIARAGHNDIYARSDFQDAMREALVALGG
ncbi:MAG: alpha/beta hydrolase [Sphingomicrobium sp.]